MIETESGFGFRVFEKEEDSLKYTYTMVNLGDEDYHLLFEEIYQDTRLICSIDALVDEEGEYERIILDTPSFERAVHIDRGLVTSDNVFVKPEKGHLGKVYCSAIVKEKYPLEGYLEETPKYLSIEDEEYIPELNTHEILIGFLNTSRELKEQTKLVRVPKN